jgi:pimeloyl-ACP methyl ester carboxylesterase
MKMRALVTTLIFAALPAWAEGAIVPGPCQDGVLPDGALSRICIPSSGWNGNLVVYAHGYVAFNEPLGFYQLDLPDGTNLPNLLQSLGFAFATTSYRDNGLVAVDAVEDIRELVESFPSIAGQAASKVYLAGVSEGGLVAALAAEREPQLFAGALSTCGPIGSFRGQVNYIGDVRAIFDVYFPGVIPGPAIDVPPSVIANWDALYLPAITAAVNANPERGTAVLRIAHVPFDPQDFSTVVRAIRDVLWYAVFATNDAADKLGGNPYDNTTRWYAGSGNDLLLNVLVQRYAAAPAALTALGAYETSGRLTIPMVTLHTLGDDVIPYAHELLYAAKAQLSGGGRLLQLPVATYGHCNFTSAQALSSFVLLLFLP